MTMSAADAGRASAPGMLDPIQILPRRGPERAMEHGAEGARAAVAELLRDQRHRLAPGKSTHSFGETHLLAPGVEAETGFASEQPGKRAAAGTHTFGPCVQRRN